MKPTLTVQPDGNLLITLDASGLTEQERIQLRALPDDDLGDALLGSVLASDDPELDEQAPGWAWVSPVEASIGTNKDIIGYITERDQDGLARRGSLYWFPEQGRVSPYQILLAQGAVVFTFGMEL